MASVFLQPPVPGFAVAPLTFDDLERVFDLGADAGELFVPALLFGGEFFTPFGLVENSVKHAFLTRRALVFVIRIALVSALYPFIAMHQVILFRLVMGLGGRRFYAAYQWLAPQLCTNMGFHPEVPLVALLRGAHLRIALFIRVLRR